ncbi:MAG: S1 RNA-binding domain-containing protein [Clostridiales bacterium]|nr:S1 RNA-binding domain-containing protein [Clostridiales bacterium]
MAETTAEIKPGRGRKPAYRPEDIITIDKMAVPEADDNASVLAWHELKSSQIKQKILSGTLSSVEQLPIGEGRRLAVGIVDYEGWRVMVPIEKEMNIIISNPEENSSRLVRVASNMIGCDVDFIVTNMDEESHYVAASRRKAMERKAMDFFVNPSSSTGKPVIQPGTVVEARVVSVGETLLRLEVFGTECFVRVFDLMEEWVADARDRYHVGDIVRVRVSDVKAEDGNIRVSVEGRSLTQSVTRPCTVQGKYMAEVTGYSDGTFFLRLRNGANAVAHSHDACARLPRKKDIVAFVCLSWDEERKNAVGMITKIIKPYTGR